MSTYQVCYDLHQPGRDYAALHRAIESYGTHYHCLESTWIIRTNSSAEEVRDHLRRHIDGNDSLLVTRLSGEAAWYGIAHGDWLKNQLAAQPK